MLIFFILFIITSIYTIKHNGTVFIYELNSLDNNYYIEGSYIKTKEYSLFQVKTLGKVKDNKIPIINKLNNCEYGIYNNDDNRIFFIVNDDNQKIHYQTNENLEIDKKFYIKAKCNTNNKKTETIKINVELTKKYDNKLF